MPTLPSRTAYSLRVNLSLSEKHSQNHADASNVKHSDTPFQTAKRQQTNVLDAPTTTEPHYALVLDTLPYVALTAASIMPLDTERPTETAQSSRRKPKN